MSTALPYPASYLIGSAEADAFAGRLFDLAEELRAGTLTVSSPDAMARIDAAREAVESVLGDLDDTARRAGLAGMLPAVNDDPSEVARVLRAVLDGVRAAPDTTADSLHLAYLAGVADGLDLAVGRRPKANESGRPSRDTAEDPSVQDEQSR